MVKLSARSEQDDSMFEGFDKPAEPTARLVEIYARWTGTHHTEYMPAKPLEAATWWVDHQDPWNKIQERPERQNDKRGNFSGWLTPYHDRVAATLKIFLELSEPEKCFVVENIERGIPWRGDPIYLYKAIIEEHEKMAQDIDGYKGVAEKIRREML